MAGRVYDHLLGTLALDDFLLEVGGEDLQAVSAVAAAHQISNQQRREGEAESQLVPAGPREHAGAQLGRRLDDDGPVAAGKVER